MKIKHLVTTRFLCKQLGRTNLLDEQLIKNRLVYLKSNVCHTLNNQTSLDFEWIIMIHPELNDNMISMIYNEILSENPKMVVKLIKYGYDTDAYIKTLWKINDVIIITRIDDDDFVNRNAINDILNIIDEQYPFEIISCGYKSGYKYNLNDNMIQHHSGKYLNGYISIFESVIYNTKCVVYKPCLNPNNIDHTQILLKLNSSGYNSKHICFDNKNAYIYFRHNDAISISENGKINSNCICMTSEVYNYLNNEFGFKYNEG